MSLFDRFLVCVEKSEQCWLWRGERGGDGYGLFWVGGRRVRAHRLAYELSVGPIREELEVMHECDTPACVRPEHLRLGTHADNMRDMIAKGRSPLGRPLMRLANPRGKLSAEQVTEIRTRRGLGDKAADLAKEFGVTRGCISKLTKPARAGQEGGAL